MEVRSEANEQRGFHSEEWPPLLVRASSSTS